MIAQISRLDIQTHRNIMLRILLKISSDPILSRNLVFKWWTALYFFYWLDRFSTDLDFDLVDIWLAEDILRKIWEILELHWKIKDLRIKRHTIFGLLSYWELDHNIKIEINRRWTSWKYSYKSLLGIDIQTMNIEDMCANKFIALTDRNRLANRDIYDIHFILTKGLEVNTNLIYERTWKTMKQYVEYCINFLRSLPKDHSILEGLWEVLNPEQKNFCKNNLIKETIFLLNTYL